MSPNLDSPEFRVFLAEKEAAHGEPLTLYETGLLACGFKGGMALHAKDAARLDWLARAGDVGLGIVVDAPNDGAFYYVSGDIGSIGYGMTLRAAIDAAMDAPKQCKDGGLPADGEGA